jgi:hypothetical protein
VAYSIVSSKVFATVIAMDLPESITLSAADLGFTSSNLIVWDGRIGVGTAHATTTITLRPCGKADYQLLHVTEAAAAGSDSAVLLGEGGLKFIPHSPMRFESIAADGTVALHGVGSGETVPLAFFVDGVVKETSCVFTGGKSNAVAGYAAGTGPYCTVSA